VEIPSGVRLAIVRSGETMMDQVSFIVRLSGHPKNLPEDEF